MDEQVGKLRIDVELVNQIAQQSGKIEKQIKDLEAKVGQQFEGLGKKLDTSLGNASKKTEKNLDGLNSKLGSTGKASVKVGVEVDAMKKRMEMLSMQSFLLVLSFQQLAKVLREYATQIITFSKTAVTAYSQLVAANNTLSDSLNISQGQANALGESIMALSMIVPVPTADLLTLSKTLGDLGVDGEKNILALTAQIAQMSVVIKDVPIDQLATDVVNIAKSFNLATSQIDNVASVILKLNQDVGGSFKNYIKIFNSVSSSADDLNISFEEVASLMGLLTESSGSVETAGEQISTLFTNIKSSISEGDLSSYGQQLVQLFKEGAPDAITTYLKSLSKIEDATERNKIATQDFGENGARYIGTLIENLDELERIQGNVASEFENSLAFEKKYQQELNNTQSAWILMQNAVQVFLQSVGGDLLPYVVKGIQTLTTAVIYATAIWNNLSPAVKKIIVLFGLFVIAAAAVIAIIFAILFPVGAIVVMFTSLVSLIGTVSGAFIAFAVIVGVVVAAIAGLVGVLALLIGMDLSHLDFTSGIKNALGIDKMTDSVKKFTEEWSSSLTKIDEKTADTVNSVGKALLDVTDLLRAWGKTFLGDYVYEFTRGDFELLDSVTSIAEQHFKLLEKAGAMSAEQSVIALQKVHGEVAQAISELKNLGAISSETMNSIQDAVGADRAASMLEEIKQGMKVNLLQDAIDGLTSQIDAIKNSMDAEVNALDEAISETENIFEGQLMPHEANVNALEKQKRELERIYKQEVKSYEQRVKTAEYQYDIEKDTLDSVKKINSAEIDVYNEEKDIAEERLDASKEALSDIKDLRDQEVEAAEGLTDYARMNLESAQNQLKKEVALGNDEYSASYRASIDRVDAAQQQADLANETYIRTKRAYDDEIRLAEDKVSVQQQAVDQIADTIKSLKRIQDAEEYYYQQRVEVAQGELEVAKDALNTFKDTYNEQNDVLQEQLDVEKSAIEDIKAVREEQLNALKSERDSVKAKYEEEINIIDEKKASAEAALKKEQDYLYTLQKLSDEYIKAINDRLSAREADLRDINANVKVGVDDVAFAEQLQKIKDNLGEQDLTLDFKLPSFDFGSLAATLASDIINFFTNLPSPVEIGETVGGWYKTISEDVTKFFSAENIGAIILAMDWGKMWGDLKEAWKTKVSETPWIEVIDKILNYLSPTGYILGFIKGALGISSDFSWETDVKDELVKKVASISWVGVMTAIQDSIKTGIPGLLATGVSIGTSIAGSIAKGMSTGQASIGNAASTVSSTVNAKLSPMISTGYSLGSKLVTNLAEGISKIGGYVIPSAVGGVKSLIQYGQTFGSGLASIGSSAYSWGSDMVENMADGIKSAKDLVGSAVKTIADKIAGFLHFSLPEEGPLSNMMTWMPDMVKNLATGIRSSIPTIQSEVASLSGVIADGISAPLISGMNIGSLDIAGAAAEYKAPTINQNQDQYIIQAGNVFATEGEMRSFARLLKAYMSTEEQRSSAN